MRRLVAMLTLTAACGDGAAPIVPPPPPPPAAAAYTLDPEVLVDFGALPADAESTREVTLTSSGDLPLTVESIRLASGSSDKWKVSFEPIEALPPGEQATLRIRFRPCPEAWKGDRIDPGFDVSACFGDVAAAGLEIMSNAGSGRRTLSLGGRAQLPPPALEVLPPEGLHFGYPSGLWIRRTKNVILRNAGFEALHVQFIDILPESARSEFFIRNLSCHTYPCPVDFWLCSARTDGCSRDGAAVLEVQYQRTGVVDRAELVIATNDPARPETVIDLEPTAERCFWPEPSIEQVPLAYCPGQPVELAARLYDDWGGTPVEYSWRWIFSPGAPPELVPEEGVTTEFVPALPGLYFIGLTATNDCGKTSQSPAVGVVEVFPSMTPFCGP